MSIILQNTHPFVGKHCETTATGSLLKHIGIEFSEPMLFGLGEGLSFIFWNMKSMEFPFIGGRVKPDMLTQNIAKNLDLDLFVQETSSQKKAWESVHTLIQSGQMVGLKLDSFYLQYFSKPFHFAGHYVAMYGFDENNAFLIDTLQQGCQVQTSLTSLAKARSEKGPMASNNLYYTLSKRTDSPIEIEEIVLKAIRNNAIEYLNPPISNISYKGILKTSHELLPWFERSKDIENDFGTTAMLMERAGTGGAIFRNLYRDFLQEAFLLTKNEIIQEAHERFIEIAILWKKASELFERVANTENIAHIHEASQILRDISSKEKIAMELLRTV